MAFSKCRKNSDGLQYACKVCKRQTCIEWEARHPGRKNELGKANYQSNRKAKLEYQRQWRKENGEIARAQYRRAALKRQGRMAAQFIEDIDPQVVYKMHGGMCGICKEFVEYDKFEVDHRVPIAKGGAHGYINCQPAHPFCNRSKKDRLDSENKIALLVNPDATVK